MALKRKTVPAVNHEDSAPDPKIKQPKTEGSLADYFDNTTATEGFVTWPPGEYIAHITEFVVLEPNEKGVAVKLVYTGHEDEENEKVTGREISQFYKVKNADGSKGNGVGFLKRDLEILGYENVTGAELEDTLSAIATEQPKVIVNVKLNGQYTNAYLKGLAED